MTTLNEEVKMFIVQSLARYETPSRVVQAVSEEFGIKISRQQAHSYDPTRNPDRVSKKLRAIFEETRSTFLKVVADIPVANMAYRLHKLQQVIERAEQRHNDVMILEALEQAAKEAGGFYTNKIKVGGDAENPLTLLLQQISGSALPVVHDVEGDFRQIDDGESDRHPVNKKPPRLMERD